MKKLTILTLFILFLAACNSPQDVTEEDENVEQEEQVEQIEEDKDLTEDEEEQDLQVQEDESLEDENEEPINEDAESSINEGEKEKSDVHQELIDLGFNIFTAQNNEDYEFLEAVLSEGSRLDKDNHLFIFENVLYPHEQEFLTADRTGDLELRYTHENDPNSIIVGFAAIDYENEYSYVIDFEFIHEDGSWKMNDMDINK